MNLKNNILKKIKKNSFKISVIGLGYVGLPLALLLSNKSKNINVYGIDIDKNKIKKLASNQSYINRISSEKIKSFNLKKNIFTNEFNLIKDSDFIIICVPTPLTKNYNPNLKFIKSAVNKIYKFSRKGQVLILESTSYPGTTEDLIVKKFEKKFKIGKDFFIGFSSERINPGKNENKIDKIPKVVSGYTRDCLILIKEFYKIFFLKIVKADTIKIAEFSKLLENIYRSVNIGFVNEMKIIADKMGIDIFDVIEIANTKPYGFRRFFPGPGVGGHCIPIDPLYLSYISKKYGYESNFIKLSAKINVEVLNFINSKIKFFLKQKQLEKNNVKILILGLAYKKNIDDHRESASIRLFELLKKNKFKYVEFYDPHYKKKTNLPEQFKMIKKLNPNILKKFDLVILMTDHDIFNYKMILKYSKYIIDCRGRYIVSDKVMRA